MPELKQILGSMVFGASRSLSTREMRRCLKEVAIEHKDGAAFAEVKESDIRRALEELTADLARLHSGLALSEVAGGYRFESDASCGLWLKHLLKAGKPQRLSHPALETLAIVAYRQPLTRADIENVRGVNVDHMVKMLLEMQLIKIVGRSELPGRPFLYGTTHAFLDHFGLRDLKDLSQIDPALLPPKSVKAKAAPPSEPELALQDAEEDEDEDEPADEDEFDDEDDDES